jgi:ferredoxin
VKIRVDLDICDLHGQCVFAAPEIFSLEDGADLSYLPEVDDALADKARAAASICPTGAIELEG